MEIGGRRGVVARVVHVYPDKFPDDCFTFASIDGGLWFEVPTDTKPGDWLNTVEEHEDGSESGQIAATWRHLRLNLCGAGGHITEGG